MAGKDEEKKPDPAQKEAESKGRADGTHPEQKRAGQEEERTLEEQASGGPEALESVSGKRPTREYERKPGADGFSRKAAKEAAFPIVALGASAGGLEALETFFGEAPADSGPGFVVITHTDPDRERKKGPTPWAESCSPSRIEPNIEIPPERPKSEKDTPIESSL